MSNKLMVFCTISNLDDANRLARALVAESLAACVNRLPGVHSTYQWEGKVAESEEFLLLIKTRADLWEPLRQRILELHPYEVPEIIAVPITEGHDAYMQWIDKSTRQL
jgi:periplasmic divalent cation tolerance protein